MKNNQGKVSMVSPCYNKVKYIGKMLDSVIAQEWDNIELILVNDGSTDGTREVISQYEPKLKQRGYEVVIIDQENAGCCAAVYAGLIRMTGDYFCLVDCDDWLDSKYVSHMANWLDTHPDCDVAACNYRIFKNGVLHPVFEPDYKICSNKLLEKWILRQTSTMVWIYMSRVSYLKKCGLIDNWRTDRNKTYEPLIGVPLMSGDGKFEYFNEPLYIYNKEDNNGLFLSIDSEKTLTTVMSYYDDYKTQFIFAINRLAVPNGRKEYLLKLVEVFYWYDIFQRLDYNENESKKHFSYLIEKLVDALNNVVCGRYTARKNLEFSDCLIFHKYVSKKIIFDADDEKSESCDVDIIGKPIGKVIVVAALGKAAEKYLGKLATTRFCPTELWDTGGDGDVVKPLPGILPELTDDDAVLCLSRNPEIMSFYRELFAFSTVNLLFADDVDKLLSLLKFMPKDVM